MTRDHDGIGPEPDVESLQELLRELGRAKGYTQSNAIEIAPLLIEIVKLGAKTEITIEDNGRFRIVSKSHRPPRTANDVYFAYAITGMVLGIAFILGGIALAALGEKGETIFSVQGTSFTSQSTGVTCVFCGLLFLVLTIPRVLRGVERSGR